MKIKRTLIMLILMLMGLSSMGLVGCGNIYANLSVELDKEEITVYLGEEENFSDEFVATVSGAGKDISTKVNYILSNPGVISIVKSVVTETETTFTVTALKGGETAVTVVTAEGDKRASVLVHVVERVTAMAYNTTYKPFVVKGYSTALNTANAVLFTPSTTTQKTVTYSLKSAADGVNITPQGVLSASPDVTAGSVTVLVTNVDAALSIEYDVKIIHPIAPTDIEVTSNGVLKEDIYLAANRTLESSIDLDIDVATSENYTITYSVSNTNVVELKQLNNQEIVLQSGIAGTAQLVIRVSIVGYSGYVTTKTIPVTVLELPSYVKVNGLSTNQSFEIYDVYSNTLGQRFTLQVGATGAYDKRIKLGMTAEDRAKVTISYADGTPVDVDNDILTDGTVIYVKVNSSYTLLGTEDSALLNVIAYATKNLTSGTVQTDLTFHLRKGVTNITIDPEYFVSVGSPLDLSFTINSDEYSDRFMVEVSDSSLLSTETNLAYDDLTFTVTGLKEGVATVTIYASNGYKKSLQVRVFTQIDLVSFVTDSPTTNANIGDATYSSNDYLGLSYYSLNTVNVQKGTAIDISAIKYVYNAGSLQQLTSGSLAEMSFVSSDSTIAAISNAGHLVAKKQGTVTITVTIKVYSDTGIVTLNTYTFTVTVFIPISSIALNASNVTVYALNSLGYFDLSDATATLKLSVYPTNATYETSQISWTIGNNLSATTQNENRECNVTGSLLSGVNNYSTYVTAIVTQFKKTYLVKCLVNIKAAVKVKSIGNFSYTANGTTVTMQQALNKTYPIYLDERDGFTSIQLNAQVLPTTAHNANFIYVTAPTDGNPSQVVSVSATGLITLLRAGTCKITVIAEDSYSDATTYSIYSEIILTNANGQTEETALHISSLSDLLKVNTRGGLDKFYVLTANIDVSSIASWQPIGIIDGEDIGFSGSVNGEYNGTAYSITGLKFVGTSDSVSSNYGLFSRIADGGTIQNLTVHVQKINLVFTNFEETSKLFFGVIAGQNELNSISHCSVILPSNWESSTLVVANNYNAIGGLIGENVDGIIQNSTITGTLKVIKSYNILSSSRTCVGGFFGINSGETDGGFDYFNDDAFFNEGGMNSNANIIVAQYDSLQNELYDSTTGTVATGGIVGHNSIFGVVTGYSNSGSIVAIDNVGGIAGINDGTILGCYQRGTISGNVAVGGIAGVSTDTIQNCVVNFLDTYDSSYSGTIPPSMTAKNRLGGLSGQASGTIIDSFVKSYFNRTSGYEGDIVLKNSPIGGDVGGLVGYSELLFVYYSYSDCSIVSNNGSVNIGGLIGRAQDTSVMDAYARGSVLVNSPVSANVGAVYGNAETDAALSRIYSTLLNLPLAGAGTPTINNSFALADSMVYSYQKTETELKNIATYLASAWDIASDYSERWYLGGTEQYNDGYPILLLAGVPLVVESPVSMTVTVNDSTLTESTLGSSGHIKVTDSSALIYFYGVGNSANTVSLNNMLTTSVLPLTAKAQFRVTSEDASILAVNGSNIIALQTGVVKLKITSVLNNALVSYVTVNIVNALTGFGLYENSDLSTLISSVGIVKNTNKTMYLGVNGNSNFNLEYASTDSSLQLLNHSVWVYDPMSSTYLVGLTSYEIQVLTGTQAVTGQTITVRPYLNAKDENGADVKVYLPYDAQTISVSIFNGIQSVASSVSSATISSKDILNITLTVQSDLPSDVTIPSGANSVGFASSADALLFTGYTQSDLDSIFVFSTPTRTVSTNTTFNYQLNITTSAQTVSVLNSLLSQALSMGREGLELKVGFRVALGGLTSTYTYVNILITPQSVYDIDMKFYSRGEKTEDGTGYNFNEVPGENIVAGRWGMMKLNLYPAYANLSEVTISYNTSSSVTLSMEQMIQYTQNDSVSYATLLPYSQPLSNGKGLSLQLLSNLTDGEYDFDGYLYINFIIQTNTSINTSFIITVSATYANGQVYTKTMSLYSDVPSEIEISHDGLTDLTYLAVQEDQNIVMMVNRLDVNANGSNITWKLANASGTPLVAGTDYNIAVNSVMASGTYTTQVNATLSLNIPVGQTLTLTASLNKYVNNKMETYTSNALHIYACVYTVDSVFINMEGLDGNSLEQPYGAAYDLSVGITTTGDDTDVMSGKDAMIASIEKSLLAWYATEDNATVLSQIVAKNNEGDYEFKSNYTNFAFELSGDSIAIRPKLVSLGDEIVCLVRIGYDQTGKQGIPTLLNDLDYTYADETDLSVFELGIQSDGSVVLSDSFFTDFKSYTTNQNASPIYTVEDLKDVQPGQYYRLANDITITEAWTPLAAQISFFDGNGYTITIANGFNTIPSGNTSSIGNFGLFATIAADAKFYNVKVQLLDYLGRHATQLTIDLTSALYTQVNFGVLAGINNGILYNCSTLDDVTDNTTAGVIINTATGSAGVITNIGGLVGQNNGSISHSSSQVDYIANRGYTGGLVGSNYGTISSSKVVLDSYINNTTTTQLSSLIGGFVAINGASGKIMLSSIDGKTVMTSSNDSNNNLFRKTNSSVNGSFNVGGFVNENSGSISDCFSNIKIISQNRSSGFVFTNKGAITNCYTASYITENHTDHTPFTGTATGGSILNTGTITNCYYLSGNLGGITNEIATPLTVTDDKVLTSQFNMFVFNTGSDYDGDWSLDTSLTGQLPLLTDANLIVSGYTWILNPNDPVNVSPEQVITYNWIYDSDNGSGIGTLTNPYVISSAEDWNQSFATFNTSYFRLVSNIVFTSTVQPNTTSVVFKGELFGSGFTVSGLSLVAENSTATSFGLFAQINQRTVGEQNTRGLVKDLTLTVDNVYANDITSVGALAGIISDSYVNHITISGADTVVQGRHFVGGLAGRIHNSSVKAISSNISINASYRGDETLGTLYNALTEANYIAYNYSYAGAVAGIVTGTSVVKGVSVTGNSRVIAYYAGTAFGLIGTGSSVSQVSVTVELTQFIRAYFVAGGVVAENRGTLSSAYISHTDSIQNNIDYNNPSTNRNLTFFAGTPKVVGGLVGFNNAGTITNSYSKIDVRSTTDKIIVLGGLVGVTAGGTVQTSFATGSVLGGTSNVNYVLGGLIGAVTNKTALKAALFSEITGYDTITNSPQTTLTNVVAFNNWLSADYAVIKLAVSKGLVVGCINSSTPDTAISASGSYMQYLSSAPDTFNSNWATGVGNRGNNLNGTDSYPYSGTAVANYYYPSGSFVLTWDKVRNKNGNYKSIFNPFSDNVFDKTLSSSYFPKLKLNINL